MTVPFATSAADLAHRATAWLATQPGDYDPSTGKGPDWGKAAPIGLLIILLLGVALFFLIRSMNKNLRRVPASFDPPAEASATVPSSQNGSDPGDGDTVAADTVAVDTVAVDTVAVDTARSDAPDEPRPQR